MVTALRVFAVLFFLSTGLAFLAWGASGFGAAGMISVIGALFAAAVSATASIALEKLIDLEKHARFIAEETLAMHRTIALNAHIPDAAE